uniref:Layilin n=1 Tax=Varanus komodoensis TaxID=61221 RepID=A0A8D2LQ63_VARKO
FVYFHDVLRRVSFHEALQSCRRDGGDLLSIESPSEQRLIEKVIGSFSASDGDFWIGLTREENLGNSTECPDSYFWSDGSSFPFRNWYADEPSCGSEVCVVMYHQPSAPDGDGGPYMFQWNDDRCGMKNNFICKYAQGRLVQGPVTHTNNKVTRADVCPDSLPEAFSLQENNGHPFQSPRGRGSKSKVFGS